MYKLEIIFINPFADLFIPDVCLSTPEEREDYLKQRNIILSKYIDPQRMELKTDRKTLANGMYSLRTVCGGFKTPDDAVEWVTERSKVEHPYRNLEIQFIIKHKIMSEINLLDENDNVIKTVHSCVNDTCVKFGNCVDPADGGCFNDINSLNLNMPKAFHIPIRVEA